MKLYRFSKGKVGLTMTFDEWKRYGEKRGWDKRLAAEEKEPPDKPKKRKRIVPKKA